MRKEAGVAEPPIRAVPTTSRSVSGRHVAVVAAVILFLCGTGALAGFLVRGGSGGSNPTATTGVAAAPTASAANPGGSRLAQFMGLSTLGSRPAPAFTLTDASGGALSLRRFRHRVVVLTFLDDRCSALCPALPEELVDAWRDLGSAARHVAFLAVNVDTTSDLPGQLAAFSRQFGLDRIWQWTFLTGPPDQLERVWSEYGESVVHGQGGSVAYNGTIYFISALGEEAYVATPYADETPSGTGTLTSASIHRWGKGIAHVAASLLATRRGTKA
jgi:cytochrome oxidase Cu insertion factor (SCO1/SenC/PrrC family)